MDQDPGEMGPEYQRAAAAGEARGPAHGLPGGRLPQHLRVLGGPRGDLPHRRRPVHPALRLLPDRHRQARAARPRRAAPGRRVACGRWACATPPSPASAATTCPTRAPGCTPRRSGRSTRSTPAPASRCSHPGLHRQPDLPAARSSTPGPRCSRTTSRRCRGSSSGSGRASATSGRSTCSRQARDAGLVTKSNLILGMGETRDEVSRGAARPARRPAPSSSPSRSTCGRRRGTTRSSAGSSRRSSSSCATRPTEIGFAGVMSGPLVRSSYRAGRLYQQALDVRTSPRLTAVPRAA